jgi:hypothetical protein
MEAVSAAPISLYSGFQIAPPNTITSYSIPLTAGNWHVGSLAGAAPAAPVLASVLGAISDLEIGGSGHAVTVGSATQSYGFALTNPSLAGLVSDTFPTGFEGWTAAGPGAFLSAWSSVGGSPGGAISDASFDTTGGLLLFVASNQYLGNHSGALGGDLTFRFEAGLGLFTPVYDPSSGTVILRGDDGIAVPQADSLLLIGTGLGLICLASWHRRASLR